MESPFAAKATDSPSRNLFPLPSATLCYQINRADVFQLFQYSTQDLAEYVGIREIIIIGKWERGRLFLDCRNRVFRLIYRRFVRTVTQSEEINVHGSR